MNSTNIKILSEEIQRLKADSGGDQAALDYLANSGNKNLIVYPYIGTTSGSGVSFSESGGAITATGESTSTNGSSYDLSSRTTGPTYLKKGKYILSGCPAGGGDNTYTLTVANTVSGSFHRLGTDTGNGVLFEITEDLDPVRILISLKKDYEIPEGGIVFKPMIRDASVQDSTWEPYSRSNADLTAEMDKLLCKQTDADTYILTATVDAQGAITYAWVSAT